jgi:hypothetical protein
MSTTGANKIRLPYPHPGQQAVRLSAKRNNWLAAGRRWRKTTLVMPIAVESALKGQFILWGAPTFDQVRIAWKETKNATGNLAKFTQQTWTCQMPGNGTIIYRSLDDPDNARGHTADGIIIDEAGDVKEAAWYEVLQPMLIDTGGWSWAVGTPKGRNWFWREYTAASDRDDAARWQIPTVGCKIGKDGLERQPHDLENPHIDFREIERIFSTTPQHVFRQEILAEFLKGEGVVFRNIMACLNASLNVKPDHHRDWDSTKEQWQYHEMIAGVDWGKLADFTAISVVCKQCAEEVALDRFNQIDYHFQRQRLAALSERWNIKRIIAESNAMGEPVIEELGRAGLPVEGFATTATTKPPLIESLSLAFEKEECQWLNIPIATSELEAYEVDVNLATGRPKYGAPSGLHDDTVIARALAWHGVTTRKWRDTSFMKV